MSAKRARLARAEAYKASEGLWKEGEAQAFSGFKGFFRKIFRRRKWIDAVSRWYRSSLKRRAKYIALYVSSGEAEKDFRERRRFAHIQRKAAADRRRALIAQLIAKQSKAEGGKDAQEE